MLALLEFERYDGSGKVLVNINHIVAIESNEDDDYCGIRTDVQFYTVSKSYSEVRDMIQSLYEGK